MLSVFRKTLCKYGNFYLNSEVRTTPDLEFVIKGITFNLRLKCNSGEMYSENPGGPIRFRIGLMPFPTHLLLVLQLFYILNT